MFPSTQLRHGDILCYVRRTNQSFFARGIRLVEGSRFTHAGVVVDVGYTKLILEQLSERTYSDFHFYRENTGEEIYAFRPRFPVPPKADDTAKALVNRMGYGYWGIADCLINHLLRRVTWGRWQPRVMLGNLKPLNIICSALASEVIDLPQHVAWATDPRLVEPDDFPNHPQDFEALGEVVWV